MSKQLIHWLERIVSPNELLFSLHQEERCLCLPPPSLFLVLLSERRNLIIICTLSHTSHNMFFPHRIQKMRATVKSADTATAQACVVCHHGHGDPVGLYLGSISHYAQVIADAQWILWLTDHSPWKGLWLLPLTVCSAGPLFSVSWV